MGRKDRPSYRRWLIKFFVVLLSLLAVVAVFNLLVDGVGVFRLSAGLKYAASRMLKGDLVAGALGGWDERELQRMIVTQYPGQRDIIVIGSSRSMQLRKNFIHGHVDFFNHSVAGAGIRDLVSIVGLYKDKGVLPGTVVFGMDPWMFNKNSGLGEQSEILGAYYNEMMTEIGGSGTGKAGAVRNGPSAVTKTGMLAKSRQLINLDYTMQNWDSFRRGKKLRVTNTADIDDFVREPDGSIHFPYRLRHLKMTQDGPANDMPGRYFKDFESFYGMDIFEGLARYLARHHVRVVFLLPPFHPHAYQSCRENPAYAATLTTEAYLRDMAARNGFTVIGSYDSAQYGFRGEDFFDGTHGHEGVMKKLFEAYH